MSTSAEALVARRRFLKTAAMPALAVLHPLASECASGAKGPLKVAKLEYLRLEGQRSAAVGVNRQPMLMPNDAYRRPRAGDFRDARPPVIKKIPIAYNYLRVVAESGQDGIYGPVDEDALFTIERLFKNLIVGRDALPFNKVWDELYLARGLSRAGYSTMAAISALDNALWDLRGKYHGLPVCALFGGPTRESVEPYASCKNYSQHPDDIHARIGELKESGFRRFKYHFSYGPSHGREGLRKNVDLVRNLRQAAGEDCEIMFDAYMSWDLEYAVEWAKQAEAYSPRFIEECFPRDRLDDYVQLKRKTVIPVATGEHLYGRPDVLPYLRAGAVDVLQCDPEWCGGINELSRVAAMAAPFGVKVVPHGQNLHAALHAVASQPPDVCPMFEYLVGYMEYRHHFEKKVPRPLEGRIAAPQAPGFGIELDPAKIEKQTLLAWR